MIEVCTWVGEGVKIETVVFAQQRHIYYFGHSLTCIYISCRYISLDYFLVAEENYALVYHMLDK